MPKTKPRASTGEVPSIQARGPPAPQKAFAVVGIGASAGGLEACTKLLSGLPAGCGMAFVLIQHLDPTHESMLVDLLATHTTMTVVQACEGQEVQPDHFYIIPPAVYLSIEDGVFHLSEPRVRHGARLPFDFFLRALAECCGRRAICVVLSGTGADGCVGLKAIKEKNGLVIAQDPVDAAYDGMPRQAIASGRVDLVLPVSHIPAAVVRYARRIGQMEPEHAAAETETEAGWLPEIIELLRQETAHDFTLYKPGTLQRRVERRMAMAAIESDGMEQYLKILRQDSAELDRLAKDLLINVTSFFRDAKTFETMEKTIIPDLIRTRKLDRPLRVWVAGCSTGEETYSLAMIFKEKLLDIKSDIKLQVFASDIDPDAVATARDGFYPESIAEEVSPRRLKRFFTREEHGYRVCPELRAIVVFTVQDILADPPFSRLDLVSCRNLLIYLRPEAQAQVIAMFHFALREGGVLLLGSAETVGSATTQFEVISKQDRIYRHIGHSRMPGYDGFRSAAEGARPRISQAQASGAAKPTDLAELGRRLVLEGFAPAAVLINHKNECLFSLGPTDRYLRVPPGHPSNDLLAMARPGLRSKLSLAIGKARHERARIVVGGVRMIEGAPEGPFNLDIRPVTNGGEELLLVCFVEERAAPPLPPRTMQPANLARIEELEQELEATRAELKTTIRDLEVSSEEQKAVHEEALSVNEEHQSTNEELLTSKEELQSLNEELTALNAQLQETLERQRKTADDLQNVLYSTDVATLFLDDALRIRFFTPATKSVFSVLTTDIGRPLADLHSLVSDDGFTEDAHEVLRTLLPREREIGAPKGTWFCRRIMPYRTHKNGVEGLVITFTDITQRKYAAHALETAQKSSDMANAAKSRFLAAASHDLRQPLQTLKLLHGLLGKTPSVEKREKLVARLGETINAMSGMLDTLLDINQIDSGTVHPNVTAFPINDVFDRLRTELTYQAEADELRFHVEPSSLVIRSDQRLLGQMIRNLVSNAFKYTRNGKVLLGCRRSADAVRIEVWDTGIGIPEAELQAIFGEYHQLDNAARERSRGLGLGLPIVQRLGQLLGHTTRVRSVLGRGSVFAIEIARDKEAASAADTLAAPILVPTVETAPRTGTILLVEDDPDIAELLEQFLTSEGHRVTSERDGVDALAHIEQAALQPDLLLTDYNLPNRFSGAQLAARLRELLDLDLPAIVLTGDISADALQRIALERCTHLSKPVKLEILAKVIQELLPSPPAVSRARGAEAGDTLPRLDRPVVYIVDDDLHVRDAIRAVIIEDGRIAEAYANSEAFLAAYRPGHQGCLLIDANLPGMSGLGLLQHLRAAGDRLPAIMITGNSDVAMAVDAMKAGADDFIEKPIGHEELLDCIDKALERSRDATKRAAWHDDAAGHIADLTPRQRQIMAMVLDGHPSKNIAADLGISQRTVENHRASIMKRTGSPSLPALARLAVTAAQSDASSASPGGVDAVDKAPPTKAG
jgi:two-component system CheB/CheR fusion protein